jgi:hypothetical protein
VSLSPFFHPFRLVIKELLAVSGGTGGAVAIYVRSALLGELPPGRHAVASAGPGAGDVTVMVLTGLSRREQRTALALLLREGERGDGPFLYKPSLAVAVARWRWRAWVGVLVWVLVWVPRQNRVITVAFGMLACALVLVGLVVSGVISVRRVDAAAPVAVPGGSAAGAGSPARSASAAAGAGRSPSPGAVPTRLPAVVPTGSPSSGRRSAAAVATVTRSASGAVATSRGAVTVSSVSPPAVSSASPPASSAAWSPAEEPAGAPFRAAPFRSSPFHAASFYYAAPFRAASPVRRRLR